MWSLFRKPTKTVADFDSHPNLITSVCPDSNDAARRVSVSFCKIVDAPSGMLNYETLNYEIIIRSIDRIAIRLIERPNFSFLCSGFALCGDYEIVPNEAHDGRAIYSKLPPVSGFRIDEASPTSYYILYRYYKNPLTLRGDVLAACDNTHSYFYSLYYYSHCSISPVLTIETSG